MARHKIKSDATLKSVKPLQSMLRVSDGDGLYLLVKPDGAKWWRFDYTIGGKRKTLEFVGHLFDLAPGAVCAAVRDQRLALRKPARS